MKLSKADIQKIAIAVADIIDPIGECDGCERQLSHATPRVANTCLDCIGKEVDARIGRVVTEKR